MPSRASVYQGIQLAPEVTAGTGLTATRRITNMELTPTPNIPVKVVKYMGSKAATDTQLGKDYTDWAYNGALDFNTAAYLLDSLFGKTTPTTPQTSGVAKQRLYSPAPNTPIAAPQTYTLEHGSTRGAEQYSYLQFSDMGITWNNADANITGKAFSQRAVRDFSITTGLPRVVPMAVDPTTIGVWISTDGVTYTRMVSDMDGELHFNGLWAPTFHVNDTTSTFDSIHERMPDFGGSLTVEEGSEADTFMMDLFTGTQIWLGIQAQGPMIDAAITGGSPEPATYNLLKFRMPVFITKPQPGDKSEIWGNTFTFEVADDDVALVKATVINKIAAL